MPSIRKEITRRAALESPFGLSPLPNSAAISETRFQPFRIQPRRATAPLRNSQDATTAANLLEIPAAKTLAAWLSNSSRPMADFETQPAIPVAGAPLTRAELPRLGPPAQSHPSARPATPQLQVFFARPYILRSHASLPDFVPDTNSQRRRFPANSLTHSHAPGCSSS